MKRCPQCDAEYDDHVEYCFVDGAELDHVRGSAPVAAPVPIPLGPRPRRSILPMVLGVGALLALSLMGVVAALAFSLRSSELGAQPVAKEGAVVPATEGQDDLEPAILIRVSTEPAGAEVWEGDTLLCRRTPCTVAHPQHAPIPRRFELRMAGFLSLTHEMSDPSVEHLITLDPVPARAPAPSGGSRLAPKPSPAPRGDFKPIVTER